MFDLGLKPDIIGSIPDLSRKVPVELGPNRWELPIHKRFICCSLGFQQFFFQLYREIQFTRTYRLDGFRALADHLYIEIEQNEWVGCTKDWKQTVNFFQKSLGNTSGERASRYELIRAWLKAEALSDFCVGFNQGLRRGRFVEL